jgi:5-methyltetrahydropteroyltriglutamate--homocysteine methyltransferase
MNMAKKYRADQVGSFLRPPAIKEAHTAFVQGKISDAERRKVEDEQISQLLEMEKESGIDVYSDGEWRRGGWGGNFADAMSEGYVPGTPAIRLTGQQNPIASRLGETPAAGAGVPGGGGPGGPSRVLGAPIVQKERIAGYDAAFLKTHAPGDFKITMPAASYVASRAYSPEQSDPVFGSRAGLLHAVAEVIRGEVKALIDEGVPYVQLDNPHYTDYVSEEIRDRYKAIGIDPMQALRDDVEADNYSISGLDRSNVTIGMHYCRGNTGGGGWHKSGGYDWLAETSFGGLNVDTFLLEYDTERAGDFAPLRYMPKGKTVVLGLVTTKFPELESQDELIARIHEAAKYVALDDLALSPQCGFASTFQGNALTPEEQMAKLKLVVSTARKVWG